MRLTNDNIEALESILFKADNALRTKTYERDRKITDLVNIYREAIIKNIHEEYAQDLTALTGFSKEAEELLKTARLEHAVSTTELEYPIGTVLYEWSVSEKTNRWHYKKVPWYETGQSGVLEVITSQSIHPGNLSDYSRAKIGDVVLRLHKKDGKLGSKYEANWVSNWGPKTWFAEGQIPEVKES